jgi:outer membrane protein TolC
LNARIPFYQGGQIRAKKIRAELELGQLENQLASVKQRLSQDLRASMNNLVTSLFNLEFTRDASSAASRSLSLVTDSYSKGALQVVDLLDAQRASISADLAQVQAFIAYFRSNIEMQRTIGVFEFLMSEAQKQNIKQQIEMTINAKLGDSK